LPANISAGGQTAPAEDGLAAQFMYENARATTRHCKLRVDVEDESAFRRPRLLLPLVETVYRQTAGWRQSQASAGTREGQLALITAGWPLTKILQDPHER
jgi:hypothetical protein